jgi:hypothetical protein
MAESSDAQGCATIPDNALFVDAEPIGRDQ